MFRRHAMHEERPPRLARGMWKRFLVAIPLIVVLTAAATATAGLEKLTTFAQEALPKSSHITTARGLVLPAYDGEPQTFLLIGSDKRAASRDQFDRLDPPHSDSMLLVHLDPNQGQTSVLSLPRDLLVSIYDPQTGQTSYPEKLNAAYTIGSYDHGSSDPAATLAAYTIEKLTGIKLNGIIDVTFGGFIDVVDQLGCVYVNVDHFYDNPPALSNIDGYSEIYLQPGYQKLCYNNALSYVRYRHDDSDFVRVARQQDFIRAVREQANINLGNIDSVLKSVGDAMRTTFSPSASELEILAKLLLFSQQKPLRQVPFEFSNDDYQLGNPPVDYVTASQQDIQSTVQDFLYGNQKVSLHQATNAIAAATSSGRHHEFSPAAIGLFPTPSSGQASLVNQGSSIPFRVLYPRLQTGPAQQVDTRAYTIKDRSGVRHQAYVVVFQENTDGGYYDVEAMNWNDPPLITNPSRTASIDGRHYIFVDDGSHIHVIAWHEHGALYWVNNTLLEDLTNAQMIGIANSVQPLG